MRCRRCDAEQDEGRNFCTSCGYELSSPQPSPSSSEGAAAGEQGRATTASDARFVACPTCGATNAASRRRCGRCGEALDGDGPARASDEAAEASGTATGSAPLGADEEDAAWVSDPPGSRLVFIAAVSVAGLAILGIILTILSASGVLSRDDLATAEPQEEVLAISSIRASSVLPPSAGEDHEPENLLDGDPRTSWRESASGDGVGEWVELELEGSREVARLIVWNGAQADGRFSAAGRVARVQIELGDRTFTADLLDVTGPQAVDLPEQVEASSVRLTILEVVTGDGSDGDAALSGVEVRGPPRSPADEP